MSRMLGMWFAIFSVGLVARVYAQGEAIELPEFQSGDKTILLIVFLSAIFALLYGLALVRKVASVSPGSQAMQKVGAAIQEGAVAYLGRQFRTMMWLVIALGIGLFLMYHPLPEYKEIRMGIPLPVGVAIAFIMGVLASYGAGYVGMGQAVRGNMRVANCALTSFKKALETAFQAGTISGMFTVGLGLLGATIIMFIFQDQAMKVLVGFGFGGCLAALFMRVGGGIFTKAADVGADLVGKIEAGIPEDDPRNAGTIADNVGDNVGDCAGMAADVFESYEVTLVAAIILGAAAGGPQVMQLVMYPLLVRAVGVFASIIGTWAVRGKDDPAMDPMQPMNRGFDLSALLSVVGFGLVSYFYLPRVSVSGQEFLWYHFVGATFCGIVLAWLIGRLTEYFTSAEKKPVTEIAHSARTGAATMILSGFSSGLESSVWGILSIVATVFASYLIFHGNVALAAYGIALSGLGLLTTTGFILAMDTYGPISDNANGIFEMSGALKNPDGSENEAANRIVARLDMVGNTTKALTKGFAIATAVIAATALFRSYMQDANLLVQGIRIDTTTVFLGLLIGGAVPFLFSSFAINAVSRAAILLVEEVRRQFREIPGIMEGKNPPEYGKCVAIATAAAQKELLGPGILAVFTPILVGFALGAGALGGYLAGAILTGQLLAVLMANAGGGWDNAKKKIEDGLFGGKGTPEHKAGVVCDTVGDPFKDTAGPALNPMIKVMNLVALLLAPVLVTDIANNITVRVLAVAGSLVMLALAVIFSKRGSVVKDYAEEEPSGT